MDLNYRMNKIKVTITNIEEHDGITKISSFFGTHNLVAITLELWQNIKVGDEAYFVFKETEVGIGKNFQGEISFPNMLDGKVIDIDEGKLLSKVVIEMENLKISSIITTSAIKKMNLKINDTVKAFIKATEISIEEIG